MRRDWAFEPVEPGEPVDWDAELVNGLVAAQERMRDAVASGSFSVAPVYVQHYAGKWGCTS